MRCISNVTIRRIWVTNVCNGKGINNAYSEFVSVDLSIQHVMLMRHIFIHGLSGSTVFFHIIS